MREPALAGDVAESVVSAIERIRLTPQSFPLIHGQFRRVVLSRFPYAVYFREQGAEILVVAVHGRQDPRRCHQPTISSPRCRPYRSGLSLHP